MGKMERSFSMEKKDTVSALFTAGRYLASFCGRKLNCSSSVEASLVMGILLLAMASFLRFSYSCCRRTNAAMQLQQMTEVLRYQEEDGQLFKESPVCRLEAVRKGKRVTAYARGWKEKWELEIVHHVFEPEEALRFGSLFSEGEEDEERKEPWTGT